MKCPKCGSKRSFHAQMVTTFGGRVDFNGYGEIIDVENAPNDIEDMFLLSKVFCNHCGFSGEIEEFDNTTIALPNHL